MIKVLFKITAIAGLCALASGAMADRHLQVVQMADGTYQVHDPKDGSTVYVKNLRAYINQKYKSISVDGFGGKLSNKTFREGSTPVQDTANAALDTVGEATGAAYNVAHRVPSWRQYTAPLRALFGSPSQNKP